MSTIMSINYRKVSIIIPTKNEEKRIALCLDAIRQLDYDSALIEVIIVDNGSTDSTVKIVSQYNCNIYIAPNKTVAGLRNLGASHATGDVLCFIDADIIVSSKWLKAALIHLDKPKIGCVTGLINIPANATWVEKTWYLNRKSKKNVVPVQWASSMNMILAKHVFMKINGFFDVLVTGEDVELSSRIRKAGFDILFDKDINVVHIGEAKTLREFIKKERWRGYSDLDLLLSEKYELSNLRHATQPLFFIISCLTFMLSWLMNNSFLWSISLGCIFVLPVLKTILVLIKQKSPIYCAHLLVIWFIYYFARSIAIFDNIAHKLFNNKNLL